MPCALPACGGCEDRSSRTSETRNAPGAGPREALASSWHIVWAHGTWAAILVEAEHQNNTRKEQRLLRRQRQTTGRPLQLTYFSRQRLTTTFAALVWATCIHLGCNSVKVQLIDTQL